MNASLRRQAAVFGVALACLLGLGGGAVWGTSQANHHLRQAAAWLDGTLEVGRPGRRDEDFARVTTVTLRDGSSFRGFECRTEACRRPRGTRVWNTTSGDQVETHRGQIVRREHHWYDSFPPGPALAMLPGVLLWGTRFWDMAFTVFVAALVPAVLVRCLDRIRSEARREHLWLAAAWALGSPATFLALNGSVWFTAQILGALFLIAYVETAWDARAPGWAGLWLGLATSCRVPLLFAVPLFAGSWWRTGRRPGALLKFALPYVGSGLVMAALNWARFDDPLEFGHRYLDVAWQPRIQEFGLFSVRYLGRNLHCLIWLLPQAISRFPYLRWSIHGMGLPLASPWVLAAIAGRDRYPQRPWLWLSVALVAIPSLLYQNSGQVQFSYRFALDWLPLLVVALAVSGAGARRWFPALVAFGCAVNVFGAWMFTHRKGQLFRHDLWPFFDG